MYGHPYSADVMERDLQAAWLAAGRGDKVLVNRLARKWASEAMADDWQDERYPELCWETWEELCCILRSMTSTSNH